MTSIKWTTEMDAVVQQLANDGLSSSRIADAINERFCQEVHVTKNSVIGRANRIGFSLSGAKRKKRRKIDPLRKDRKVAVKTERRPKDPSQPALIPLETYFPASAINTVPPKLGLLDLKRLDCRWTDSVGHPSAYEFCGAPVKGGSSYCAEHHARVYLKTARKY